MLSLPTTKSELRSLFEIEALVDWKSLPTFRNAIVSCRNTILEDSTAKGANAVCIRANGEIWLITVGARGGWKKLWNFGKPIA